MGIGNGRAFPAARGFQDTLITPHGDRKTCPGWAVASIRSWPPHYPSWGSETEPPTPGQTYRQPAHYPSWGSETRAYEGEVSVRDISITPHGDRKLGHPRPAAPTQRVSLITPHGGSETAPDTAGVMPSSDCSLPLMGIGNSHTGRNHLQVSVQPLITPHGDRKPS